MFTDLFGLIKFDKNNLIRFILTVRKNYRRVPYHNWTHGFSVSNCMYSIIKHSSNVFKPNEVSKILQQIKHNNYGLKSMGYNNICIVFRHWLCTSVLYVTIWTTGGKTINLCWIPNHLLPLYTVLLLWSIIISIRLLRFYNRYVC